MAGSDRQQLLVNVIRGWQAAYPHVVVLNPDGVDQFAEEVALVVEPLFVAAERAGYERGRATRLDWLMPYRCDNGHYFEDLDTWEGPNMAYQCECGGTIRRTEDSLYERCKQDAATAIKALWMPSRADVLAALAALAALNATQQEVSDGSA
jgi:hypothetical protein